ncbi:MAG: hypothetical protein ACLPPF_13750 [Rhodomicrobium sp.]
MNSAGKNFWKPGRLIDLWDLMKKLDGNIFGAWNAIATTYTTWSSRSLRGHNIVGSELYQPATHAMLREFARSLATAFQEVELDTFANAAKELISEIDKTEVLPNGDRRFSGQNLASAAWQMRILAEHVPVSMQSRFLLMMREGSAELYAPKGPLFGIEVAEKFRTTAKDEIEDAGKCLALDRNTACAFHLLRAVEHALEAVQKCLQLPEPVKGPHKAWGAVLNRYAEELDGREHMTWPRQWSSMQDRQDFKEIYQYLSAVKDTCRDKTMHVEKRYDAEQAKELFDNVKAFMKKVASRLDEDGLPRA